MRADSSISGTRCIVLSSLGERVPGTDGLNIAAWLTKPVRSVQLRSVLHRVSGESLEATAVMAAKQQSNCYADLQLLLVEDNVVNQKVARHLMKTFGATADIAEDGSIALNMVQRKRYDVVFMDCQMPVMDGYEATRAIRAWGSAAMSTVWR